MSGVEEIDIIMDRDKWDVAVRVVTEERLQVRAAVLIGLKKQRHSSIK